MNQAAQIMWFDHIHKLEKKLAYCMSISYFFSGNDLLKRWGEIARIANSMDSIRKFVGRRKESTVKRYQSTIKTPSSFLKARAAVPPSVRTALNVAQASRLRLNNPSESLQTAEAQNNADAKHRAANGKSKWRI